MVTEGSVGSVYLDLVVRDTVQKQVEDISAKAQAGAKQSFEGLEQVVERAVARATRSATSAATTASRAAVQAAEAAQRAVQAMTASAASGSQQVEAAMGQSFDKGVALAQAKVAQLERAFDGVGAKLDALWNSGNFDPEDKVTKSLLAQQERLYAQLEAARERLAIEVQAAAQRQAAEETAQARRAAVAQQEASAQQSGAAEASAQAQTASISRVRQTADAVFQWMGNAGRSAFSALGQAATHFGALASRAFSGLRTVAVWSGKALGSLGRRFSSVGKAVGTFGSRLKEIVTGALVFNMLSQGMSKITQYLTEAVGASIELQDALANLKGAASVAATPIIEVLTPALVALANGTATVLSYFSRLVSFLTGKSVDSMTATAKKLNDTTDAAKKAKAALAGFDEIQRLDGGSDGGDGSGDRAPNYDFQGRSSFLDAVLAAVQKGDWGQVGALVAQKLNGAMASIPWPDIQEKAGRWASGLAQVINGAVGALDFLLLGGTIANGLNTIIIAVNTFFQETDWEGIGAGVGTGLSGMFQTLDWEGVGKALTNGISTVMQGLHGLVTTFDFSAFGSGFATATMAAINNVDWVQGAKDLGAAAIGLVDALTEWIKGVDWQQIGDTVAEMLAAVDWSGLVSSLVAGIGAVCAGLAELIWGIIDDAWEDVVTWWEEAAYEDGEFTMEGLLQGIEDKLLGIGQWVYDHVFTPFMDAFRGVFDIHSPSGVMEEQGGFLIQGLLNGISGAWSKITEFFDGALSGLERTMDGFIGGLAGWASGTWENIKSGASYALKSVRGAKMPLSFGVPKLADGGVIRQPTLALMGEYSGAGSDPEIAAPQSMLRQTMEQAMGGYSGDMVQCCEAVVAVLEQILEAVMGIELDGQMLYNKVETERAKMAVVRGAW